jgi:hypothetical protein
VLFKIAVNIKTFVTGILIVTLITLGYKGFGSIKFRYAAYLIEKEKRKEAEEENKYWSKID